MTTSRLNELFGTEKPPEPSKPVSAAPPVESVAKPPTASVNLPPEPPLAAAPPPAPVAVPAPVAEAVPRTPAPAPKVTLEPEKRRSETFLVKPSITARVKSAVFYTPGLSQAELVDNALAEYVTKLEKARGEPFPRLEKGQKPRVGRPISL